MMNKTKIDWADMTWNPVTGCNHGCTYCYAKKIANRFGMPQPDNACHIYTGKVKNYDNAVHTGPYPYGFAPTLHTYRLADPKKIKKSQTIFVCSMADLFGYWVPDEWIQEVFKACESAPQHRYLFLTKNPDRYSDHQEREMDKMYFGASATTQDQMRKVRDSFVWLTKPMKRFVSIEPIQEPIHIDAMFLYDWVIVGAETGNRKEKSIPNKTWIDNIAEQCKLARVPIFMKESLRELMGADFIQEYPWEVK
jgi:protein gp37